MALTPSPAPAGAPPGLGAPPGGGAPPMGAAPGDDADAGSPDDNVICTVCKNEDGTYTVYQGDEPEGGDEDMSSDDASAMGPAGDQPSNQGQQAGSVGEALKLVMSILQQDAQSGGGAEAQFASGFNGDQSPTPASGQKY